MSLQGMVTGYSGATGAFEGVSAEDLAKYNEINGPITMAMEAAELYNEAFMEGFYKVNEAQIEAALEGHSCVMEGERWDKFKSGVKKAFGKLAALFKKMAAAVKGFFANIAGKIKEKCLKANKFFNRIPGNIKVLEYKGLEYRHLDEIKDILSDVKPSEVLGSAKGYSKILSGDVKDLKLDEFKDDVDKKILAFRSKFGVPNGQSDNSATTYIQNYFKQGSKMEVENVKVNVSYVQKVTKMGEKISKDLENISKEISKDYESYAKQCEKFSKGPDDDGDNEKKVSADVSSAWMAVANASRRVQSLVTSVLNAWNQAYVSAISAWETGARKYVSTKVDTSGGYTS